MCAHGIVCAHGIGCAHGKCAHGYSQPGPRGLLQPRSVVVRTRLECDPNRVRVLFPFLSVTPNACVPGSRDPVGPSIAEPCTLNARFLLTRFLTYSLPYLLASLPRREYREYKAKEKEGTLSAEGQDLVGAFRKATEEDRAE